MLQNKNNLFLLLGLFIVFSIIGLFLYKTQIITSNNKKTRVQPIHQNYTQLINNWNKQVQNNTSSQQFLLSRESNDDLIEHLNEWMKNFYIPEITDSEKYNDFLEKNKVEQQTYFDTDISGEDIRNSLKMVTKEKVMSGIVKKVLMMNNIDFWRKNKNN